MKKVERPLIRLSYGNVYKKIAKSFCGYYFLPPLLVVVLTNFYALSTYETIMELAGAFAASGVMVAGIFILSLSILVYMGSFIILLRRYRALDIYHDRIVVNADKVFDIDQVEFVPMPYAKAISEWFELKEKKSGKTIGHFVCRFYDVYLLDYGSVFFKRLFERVATDESTKIVDLVKEEEVRIQALKNRNEKLRKLTCILFLVFLFQLVAMLVMRAQV